MAFASGFSGGYSAVSRGMEARRRAQLLEREEERQERERQRKLGLLEALPETMGSYIGAQEAGRAVEVPIESQAMGLEAGLPPVTRTAQPWASTAEMLRESPEARRAAGKLYQATGKFPWDLGGPMESVELSRERVEKQGQRREVETLGRRAADLISSPDRDDRVAALFLIRRIAVLKGEAPKDWVEQGIKGEDERKSFDTWFDEVYQPYIEHHAKSGRSTAEQDLAFLRDTYPYASRVPFVMDELKVWSKRFQRDRDPAVRAGGRYTELRLQGRDHQSAMAQVMRENPDGWLQVLTLGEEYVPAALKPYLKEAFRTEREQKLGEAELTTKQAAARKATADAKRAEEGGAEPRNLAEAQRMLNEALRSMNPENLRLIDPEDRPAVTSAAQEQIRYLQDWIAKHRGGGAPPASVSQTPWDQLAPEQKKLRADRAMKNLFGQQATWATLTPEQKKRVLEQLR